MNQTGTKSGLGSSRVTNGIRETIYRLPRKDATSLELAELKLELGPLPSSSARPAKSGMRKQADFKVRERSEDLESWCKQDKENGSKAFQSYSNLFRGDADAWTSSEFDWPANAEPKRIMAIESIMNPDVRLEKHRIYWDECVSKAAETEMKEEATLAATIENKSDSNQEEYRSLLEEEDSDDESLPPGLEEDDGDSESSDSDDEPQDFIAPVSQVLVSKSGY
jgi:hypothetical protein